MVDAINSYVQVGGSPNLLRDLLESSGIAQVITSDLDNDNLSDWLIALSTIDFPTVEIERHIPTSGLILVRQTGSGYSVEGYSLASYSSQIRIISIDWIEENSVPQIVVAHNYLAVQCEWNLIVADFTNSKFNNRFHVGKVCPAAFSVENRGRTIVVAGVVVNNHVPIETIDMYERVQEGFELVPWK